MKRMVKILLIGSVIFLFLSACALTNLLSTVKNAGGGETDDSGSGGSSGAGGVVSNIDTTQFTGSINPGMVRTDKKKFSEDDFHAGSIPVESVTFTGEVTPEVRFKGALAEPDYWQENPTSMRLHIFLVMYLPGPAVLIQEGQDIIVAFYDMHWKVDMFDAGGALLESSVVEGAGSISSNYLRVFDGTVMKAPLDTASVAVTVIFNDAVKMMYSCRNPTPEFLCVTPEELDFTIPDPIVYITPIQLTMEMGETYEDYAKPSAQGSLFYNYKNPFDQQLHVKTFLLFTDDSGKLVGYLQDENYLEPGVYDRRALFGDAGYITSYFSAIPTQVQVYHTAQLKDLIEATR